jgi:RHS repeat-associated protein
MLLHSVLYQRHTQSANTGGYRYFFNGQEVDNEVFGETANFGYEFRQYDSRLGRWWSVDPKWGEYPGNSPFVFCKDSPIMLMDVKGREASETSSLDPETVTEFEVGVQAIYQFYRAS